jgi:uncharacterized membrane protein YkgB
MDNTNYTGFKVKKIGEIMMRYGLVIILIWVGALKFTTYEAKGIQPLVENSGLLSWAYDLTSVQGFSIALGIIEIILGLFIAARYFAPR